MARLPKYAGRGRGPLNSEEDEVCRRAMSAVLPLIESLFEQTGHRLVGRIHRWGPRVCPALYVFYSNNSYAEDQRGLMYLIQPLPGGGFEIVFRMWRGCVPLPNLDWDRLWLANDSHAACRNYDWRWRSLHIRSRADLRRARRLILAAKSQFEAKFGLLAA